jgi:TonB family protein
MRPTACVSLLVLFLAGCAAKGVPAGGPVLTPESDPDVQAAIPFPQGATPPRKIVDARPQPPARQPPGTRFDALLDAVITPSGEVKVVSIVKSTDAGFTRACIRAMQQWRFEPARTTDGKPFAMRMQLTCNFTQG